MRRVFTSPSMINTSQGDFFCWFIIFFRQLYQLQPQEDVQPMGDVFLTESCQAYGDFPPMLQPSSHSLLIKYNTFNSWEPRGEREKRVINVTCAVGVGTAILFPCFCIKSLGHLNKHPSFNPYICTTAC